MYDLCTKDGGTFRLFHELKEGIPDWIPYLPVPGTYKHPKHGDIVITRDRNQRFINNFHGRVYQETLPVDAEHQGKLSGALAHIKEMRVNDNGSVDARVEWTDRGRKMMDQRAFRYFSPEFFNKWTDPATGEAHDDVAAGGALTNRPFFKDKHLRPLVAASEEIYSLDDNESSDGDILHFAPLPHADGSPGAGGDKKMSDTKDKPVKLTEFLALSEEEQLKILTSAEEVAHEVEELKGENEKLKGQVDTLKATQETKDEQIDLLSKRVTGLETNERTRRFTDLVEGETPWAGEKDKQLSLLIKLAESFGEDSDEFKAYVEQQNAIAAQLAESGIFITLGEDDKGGGGPGDAGDKLIALAEEKVKQSEGKLSLADAMAAVAAEKPELYDEDKKESQVKV